MFFFLWETLCQNSLTPPTQEKMHKFMYNGLSLDYLEITETINQLKLNWRVVFKKWCNTELPSEVLVISMNTYDSSFT